MAEQRFTLKREHILLLRAANIGWEDCEFGAPAIDCKRPYGNSDVIGDIARLLGVKPFSDGEEDHFSSEQRERLDALHRETQTALQVILTTGSFEPGEYVQTKQYDYRSWKSA